MYTAEVFIENLVDRAQRSQWSQYQFCMATGVDSVDKFDTGRIKN